MSKKRKWTLEEINFLRQNYTELGSKKCSNYINRSMNSIRRQAINLGLNAGILWTKEEISFLQQNTDKTIKWLSKQLDRSSYAIATKRKECGIIKHKIEYKDVSLIKLMSKQGYTNQEIAKNFNVSSTYISGIINNKFIIKDPEQIRLEKQKNFQQIAHQVHNYKYKYQNDFFNNKKLITIECPIHGDFLQRPSNHLVGQGCYKCYINDRKLDLEPLIQQAEKIHGKNRYDYSRVYEDYKTTRSKAWIKCNLCNIWFKQKIATHIYLKGGCRICNESQGESKIRKYLTKHKINHKQYYKIPWESTYREFDFYLPNLSLMIEFHGEQHYKSVAYFDKKTSLKERQQNDKQKRQYCLDNNIKLVEIPYWDFDKIEEILNKELNV